MAGISFGSFTLHTIETGRFALDGGAMFGIVPRTLWERKIKPDDRNRIPLAMRCLLVETGDRLVLIDCGLGDKSDARFREIYKVDTSDGGLLTSLKTAGFSPSDVTDVILTHLHFDHCGGGTAYQENTLATTFPGATYHVQHDHWEWATNPNGREQASFLNENLQPLERSGQLRFTQGEEELIPGIHCMVVNGHTMGQQLVRLESPERSIVYVADLLPTTAHLPPAWIMGYDVQPLVTLDEKISFLDRAINQNWTLFYEHDPVCSISDLGREGDRVVAVDERTLEEL